MKLKEAFEEKANYFFLASLAALFFALGACKAETLLDTDGAKKIACSTSGLKANLVKADSCQELSNYSCSSYQQSPFLSNSQSVRQECLSFKGSKNCIDIKKIVEDSSAKRNSSEFSEEDFVEGGELNTTVYECHSNLPALAEIDISPRVSSLDEAIEGASKYCQSRVKNMVGASR